MKKKIAFLAVRIWVALPHPLKKIENWLLRTAVDLTS